MINATSLSVTDEERTLASWQDLQEIPMQIYQEEMPYLRYGLIFLGIVLIGLFFAYRYIKSKKKL